MLCPSCGKEIVETDVRYGFCGSSLSHDKPPSGESPPSASVAALPGSTDQPPKRNGEAIASLVLGIFPFAFVAVVWVLAGVFGGSLLSIFLTFGILCLTPVVGVLAVNFGHRARASIRQSGERLLGERIAIAGLVLGYVGLACWILAIVIFFLFSDL
jgi:hypothetical protein